jgi:hypothetical protein
LLKNALNKYNNPKQMIRLPWSRELLNDPDRWQQYMISLIDKDIGDFLNESHPETESITETSSQSDYFQSHWSARLNVSFLGFFHVGGASAEQTKIEKHVRDNVTKIDISFTNLDTFPITRGEWYDEQVISRFASIVDYNTFFGPNGQLEMIPHSLLVGRGMSFTIYADSSSLDYLYEYLSASGDVGFGIGYFTIGAGGGYSSTKEQTKTYRLTDRITYTDLSGRGKVLAVLCKHFADSVSKPKIADIASLTTDREALATLDAQWVPSRTLEQIGRLQRSSDEAEYEFVTLDPS